MHGPSIRARLLFCYALSLALLLGVSTVAFVGIVSLDRATESLNRKWVGGARILGEMADLITEVRLGEAHISANADAAEVADSLAFADEHIEALAEERAEYAALDHTSEERALIKTFDDLWNAWHAAHVAWTALPSDRMLAEAADFQKRADGLYRAADDAIDALTAVNTSGAKAAGEAADRIADRSVTIFGLAALLALLLAGWVFLIIRNQISRPLASITTALAALAEGDRSIVTPESHRGDEIGKLAKAFEVFRSNAFALEEAHKRVEEAQSRAQNLARHDPLTGLANRRLLAEEMTKALARVARGGAGFAVLLIDLDRFKPVNDIYGHSAGDDVLTEVTARLVSTMRKHDTLARLGGDEFAAVFEIDAADGERAAGPTRLAERILTLIGEPVLVGESRVEIGASIGIALCPDDGTDTDTILRAADIAMYRAKEAEGHIRFFAASMDAELRARAELETAVRRAVLGGDIKPNYQPLVDLSDNRLTGFEVLARWEGAGQIEPDQFIPIIEHLGLMPDFTVGMLRRACIDARQWPSGLRLALNVSAVELKDVHFPMRVLAVLSETGFDPRRLEIEITESALLTDLDTASAVIASLHNVGIKVALDDFGTGYSSLSHLRELHLDNIKIDRTFVQSLNSDPESAKIVNAIVGLAKSLGLPTTAEGIEDVAVLAELDRVGCTVGQGFFFGKAMPAEAIDAWMANHGDAGLSAKIA